MSWGDIDHCSIPPTWSVFILPLRLSSRNFKFVQSSWVLYLKLMHLTCTHSAFLLWKMLNMWVEIEQRCFSDQKEVTCFNEEKTYITRWSIFPHSPFSNCPRSYTFKFNRSTLFHSSFEKYRTFFTQFYNDNCFTSNISS